MAERSPAARRPRAGAAIRRLLRPATALVAGLGAGASAAPAAPAPVLHYAIDADDVSSGRVSDSSGHGLDGTLVNPSTAALVDAAHASDRALALPGGGDPGESAYVRLPRGVLPATGYEAEDAARGGTAHVAALSLASGAAVDGLGGARGNGNDLTFSVSVKRSGTYAIRVRYSNPESGRPRTTTPIRWLAAPTSRSTAASSNPCCSRTGSTRTTSGS
jgi:hypothetical protein